MRKIFKAAASMVALAATVTMATAAHADDSGFFTPKADGKFQVKVLVTDVVPNGKINKIKSVDTTTVLGSTLAGLPTSPQTYANDNVVPTVAIEYFATPNISVETICCFTNHRVYGAGSLAGTELVDHMLILPATITAKYHFTGLPMGISPYIGAGPAVFFTFGTRPGATATALGVTSVRTSDSFGGALQAGLDLPLGKSGFALSLDAKRYWVKTTADFYAGSTLALSTQHNVDPWVLSTGIAYRF